jgi:hypothetical protein
MRAFDSHAVYIYKNYNGGILFLNDTVFQLYLHAREGLFSCIAL